MRGAYSHDMSMTDSITLYRHDFSSPKAILLFTVDDATSCTNAMIWGRLLPHIISSPRVDGDTDAESRRISVVAKRLKSPAPPTAPRMPPSGTNYCGAYRPSRQLKRDDK